MNVNECYEYCKARIDKDYPEFEGILTSMLDSYADDYNEFLKIMETTINGFCRFSGRYLNNTMIDTLFQYLCTRRMLDNAGSNPLMFEFSPMRGWSTYIQLKAIKDSGRTDVKLISYELDKANYEMAKENLYRNRDHIAHDSLELVHGDVFDGLNKLEDQSVDWMFIDSDHGKIFTQKYIEAGVFNIAKPDAYIHIHDFWFMLNDLCPDKWREPEVVAEHMKSNESRFSNYTIGQLFHVLGGTNTTNSLVSAREATDGVHFSDANYFVKNNYTQKYWLGGSIAGVNTLGFRKSKTRLSGLALWMIPSKEVKRYGE